MTSTTRSETSWSTTTITPTSTTTQRTNLTGLLIETRFDQNEALLRLVRQDLFSSTGSAEDEEVRKTKIIRVFFKINLKIFL